MGMGISSLFSRLFGKKKCQILMIGFDNVGKTTILYQLKLGEIKTTMPTIGFNVETIEHKNLSLNIWDVGAGGGRIYVLWRSYCHNNQGIIYVIDSSDRDEERIDSIKHALKTVLEDDENKNIVILVLANKMDLPDAMSCTEITEKYGLDTLFKGHSWYIQRTSATQALGLYEGVDWLSKQLA